jgi:3-oxoacyl-[acyl-carrier-protein] synthase III
MTEKFSSQTSQFGAKIIGWGRALPNRVVTNFDLEKLFDTSDEWITQRTGIKERRIADATAGETAISLGARAGLQAIEAADIKIEPEQIDLIICATATGDYLFPSTSCMIQHELAATNAVAFDISAACTGFIFALNNAYNFIKSGQFKNVLVIGVDLMSRFCDWSDRSTAIIFGDGAGAALLTATSFEDDQFKPFYIKSRGDSACSLYVKNIGNEYPIAASAMTNKPEMVYMDGQSVYQFAVKAVPEALQEACDLAGIQPSEIDYVVPHQANLRIIDSAAKRLKIPLERFICNIDRYGNTSAASIPIAFSEALELGKIIRPHGKKLKIALVGFGAGLTWGATIIEF